MVLKPETKTQNISKVKKSFDIVFVIKENSKHPVHECNQYIVYLKEK